MKIKKVSKNKKTSKVVNIPFLLGLAVLLLFVIFYSWKTTKTFISGQSNKSLEKEKVVIEETVRIISEPIDSNTIWKTYKVENSFVVKYPTDWSTERGKQGSQQGDMFNASYSLNCGEQYCPTASVAINGYSATPSELHHLQNILDDGWNNISDAYWVQAGKNKYLHYTECSMGCYDKYIHAWYDNDYIYEISFYNSFFDEEKTKYKNLQDQILSNIEFQY